MHVYADLHEQIYKVNRYEHDSIPRISKFVRSK